VQHLSTFAAIRVKEMPEGALDVSLSNSQPLESGISAGQLQVDMLACGEQQLALAF